MEGDLTTYALENLDQESAGVGAAMGFIAGFGVAAVIAGLVILVLTIIAMWRIFTKAGEKGWKSIIPIYSSFILFRIAGRNFWKYLGIVVLSNLFSSFAQSTTGVVSTILIVLACASAIWGIVEFIRFLHGLSKNFGHGAGFTVGLFFLNTIFLLVLGLGSSQYKGNNSTSNA